MRTVILILGCLILLSTLHAQNPWKEINVDNSSSRFRDVCVVNEYIIWAVKAFDTTSNICRTTNGGLNWQIFSLGEIIYFISAINENQVWVSTLNGDVYKSINGGINWIQQNYSPKAFINYLKFFNANTGFFIADPNPVYDTIGFFYTRNGGTNWIRPPHSPLIYYNVALTENCVNAIDTNFIWFCACTAPLTYRFYCLKGGFGAQWQSYSYGENGGFRYAVFKDTLNGLAASPEKIMITSNGGINWILRSTDASVDGWVTEFMLVPGSNWVTINSPRIDRKSVV